MCVEVDAWFNLPHRLPIACPPPPLCGHPNFCLSCLLHCSGAFLWQDVNGKQDEQLQAAVSSQTSSLQVSRHAWALCVSLTPFEHRILTITRATVLTLTLALARLFKPR